MLVLSRQKGQKIMVGDDIEITVIDVRGDKARLGVQAPRDVSVHRKEIYDAIHAENRDAARVQVADVQDIVGAIDPSVRTPAHPPQRPHPSSIVPEDAQRFLAAALEQAQEGLREGGLPIGAVLVRDGQIIGRGHNRRVQQSDPMAHAEIDCLRSAGRQSGYRDCVLYSTLMPCFLCSGAVVQFGIRTVVVGESVNFAGAPQLLRQHGVEVADLHDARCIEMMAQFIREHPQLWHEDIGG